MEKNKNLVEIDCYECDGKGWMIIHQWSGYPEQDRCSTCNGEKKLMVSQRFAKYLLEEE